MNWDLMAIALLAGAANWAFRVLPTIARSDRPPAGGWLQRFLSATGPAAIGTLFVASIFPFLAIDSKEIAPLATGTSLVLLVYLGSRSVAAATLGGAIAFGLTVWLVS